MLALQHAPLHTLGSSTAGKKTDFPWHILIKGDKKSCRDFTYRAHRRIEYRKRCPIPWKPVPTANNLACSLSHRLSLNRTFTEGIFQRPISCFHTVHSRITDQYRLFSAVGICLRPYLPAAEPRGLSKIQLAAGTILVHCESRLMYDAILWPGVCVLKSNPDTPQLHVPSHGGFPLVLENIYSALETMQASETSGTFPAVQMM